MRRQTGFALVELLVALVIGLVVVGAVFATFLRTGKTGRLQSALSQMDEDAQIGLRILSGDLLMAGYAQAVSLDETTSLLTRTYSGRPVFGCVKGFASAVANTPAECSSTGSSPAIEISFEADVYNTLVTNGQPADCLGNSLLTGPEAITYNRYRVGNGALQCTGPRGNAAPLVDNVEALQVWYGEAGGTDPRVLSRYVTADLVQDFTRIVSVRVCLLMRSAEPVLTADDGSLTAYLDCDSVSQTSSDARLRRAYSGTVALRNKMPL